MLEIRELDQNDREQMQSLQNFCDHCANLGIVNNSSFAKMKLTNFGDRSSLFWTVSDKAAPENGIVGISGCHHLPELGPDFFRILFRGCMLPEYRAVGSQGLSKKHLNSYLFRAVAPLQIRWAQQQGGQRFVITTNVHPELTGTSDTDRIFHLLEKQGIVTKIRSEVTLFTVPQNVWQIDPQFFEAL